MEFEGGREGGRERMSYNISLHDTHITLHKFQKSVLPIIVAVGISRSRILSLQEKKIESEIKK